MNAAAGLEPPLAGLPRTLLHRARYRNEPHLSGRLHRRDHLVERTIAAGPDTAARRSGRDLRELD
jgi:hypothetical protein